MATAIPFADARVSRLLRRVLALILAAQLAGAVVAIVMAVGTDPARPDIVDFHAFVAVGRLALEGRLAEGYGSTTLAAIEHAMGDRAVFMPYGYPPPFGLLLAPLALLPIGFAFLVFTGTTLAFFLAALRRLAGPWFWTVLLTTAPAVLIDLRLGQNGFLTAGLAGLSALMALRGRSTAAGVAAGVLAAFKPHLALGLPLLFLLRRDGRAFWVSGLTVLLSGVAALAVFGPATLPAFLGGLAESGRFMTAGLFPLHRMVSVDAFLMAAGVPSPLALLGHGLVACGVLATVAVVAPRLGDPRAKAGLALLATPFLSPYFYDYDLTLLTMALGLMLPALARVLPARRLDALLVGFALAGGLGLLTIVLMAFLPGVRISLAGPALLVGFGTVVATLRRDEGRAAAGLPTAAVSAP